MADVDAKVDQAMEWFKDLKVALQASQPASVKRFLMAAIEQIKIRTRKERWTAKRFKYHLDGGEIHLKSFNLLSTVHRAGQVVRIRPAV